MNNPILVFKLAIVGAVELALFVLVALGKATFAEAVAASVTLVGALVVALGITGAGNAIASAARPDLSTLNGAEPAKRLKLGMLDSSLKAIAYVIGMAFVARALVACSPKALTADAASANFAACVITTYAADHAAGMTDVQIATDEVQKCGGTAEDVAKVLDAHKAAEEKELAVTAGAGH